MQFCRIWDGQKICLKQKFTQNSKPHICTLICSASSDIHRDVCLLWNIMELDGTRPVVLKATKEYICLSLEIMTRLHKITYISCCEQCHVGTIFFSTKLHPPSVSPHRRKHASIQGREANDVTLKCPHGVARSACTLKTSIDSASVFPVQCSVNSNRKSIF